MPPLLFYGVRHSNQINESSILILLSFQLFVKQNDTDQHSSVLTINIHLLGRQPTNTFLSVKFSHLQNNAIVYAILDCTGESCFVTVLRCIDDVWIKLRGSFSLRTTRMVPTKPTSTIWASLERQSMLQTWPTSNE